MGVAPVAILLLGGRVAPGGRPTSLLVRRIDAAAEAAKIWPEAIVVACGGRSWEGFVEADVMARALVARSIDERRVVRERISLTTLENLREGRAIAGARGKDGTLAIVSCDWHLPRAMEIARALGIDALAVPARSAPTSTWTHFLRQIHESIALPLDRMRARVR